MSNSFSKVMLIMGTDASGKNHVARVLGRLVSAHSGGGVQTEGWFTHIETKNLDEEHPSEESKSRMRLLTEALFIRSYPLLSFLLPVALAISFYIERWRYQAKEGHQIVVSHIPTRLLAFYLAHLYDDVERAELPGYLAKHLQSLVEKTRVKAIVLNVNPEIRRERIARRELRDSADPFDRYLMRNEHIAERYQAFLIWLATSFFDASLVHNNDLSDEQLNEVFHHAFKVPA